MEEENNQRFKMRGDGGIDRIRKRKKERDRDA